MGIAPSLIFGHVMHKRLSPKVNAFSYGIYYLAFPLSQLKRLALPINRFGLLSFHNADHAKRDGSDLESWARSILTQHGLTEANGEMVLITMPRILGYVFNPISFWICYDKKAKIRAVLCEVNNTFGESHTYLCAHSDHREIKSDDVFEGEKVLHVSPFLPREGHYIFRFDISEERCGLWINYHDADGEKQLVTALTGNVIPMSSSALRRAFWAYPLVTFKAITLIHWQALKLLATGIKYIARPPQKQQRITTTRDITNF